MDKIKKYSNFPAIIEKSKNIKEIKKNYLMLKREIIARIDKVKSIKNITSFITSISDEITKKLVVLATSELGSPPCEFAFMALGSEGRQEQTLKTDQDNAIIYENTDKKSAKKYFLELGRKICDNLHAIGYDYCKGNVMAKNSKWCKPLSVWKKYFSDWIDIPNPLELRKVNIFFDFRYIYGNENLTRKLKKHISACVKGKSVFFLHLAENALSNKPPVGFFGNLITDGSKKHKSLLNIKKIIGIITDFARIYDLNCNIAQTNTLERLKKVFSKKILEKTEYENMVQAYTLLMQMRFAHQAELIKDGRKPDNYINPRKLTDKELKNLKQAILQLSEISKKMKFLVQFGLVD